LCFVASSTGVFGTKLLKYIIFRLLVTRILFLHIPPHFVQHAGRGLARDPRSTVEMGYVTFDGFL
jgi:hypothetical protein